MDTVKQSTTSDSKVTPPEPDSTKLLKHILETSSSDTVKVVKTPSPAGIVAPVNENPNVTDPAVTINPLDAAAPPDAL